MMVVLNEKHFGDVTVVTRRGGGVNGILPIMYITFLYLLLLDSEVHKYLFVLLTL